MKKWKTEPDKKAFTYKGYNCLILRHTQGMEHLCGYVGVQATDVIYGVDYHNIPVKVHGGLTFSEPGSHIEEMNGRGWWVGFDCAHGGDLIPGMEKYIESSEYMSRGVYRDMEYVEAEIKRLVDQIVELNKDSEIEKILNA